MACALAAKRPSRALILMSTFTSVRSMLKRHMLPGFLALDPFDNLSVVKRYENPILVLHGRYDEILPYDHGVKLADAAPDAELITLNCGHNDCVENWTEFWGMVEPFLREAGALP